MSKGTSPFSPFAASGAAGGAAPSSFQPDEADRPSPNRALPDFEKPVTDVYRAGTVSDIGLFLSDMMSPGRGGFWGRFFGAPKQPSGNLGATQPSTGPATAPPAATMQLPQQQAAGPTAGGGGYLGSWGNWLRGGAPKQ